MELRDGEGGMELHGGPGWRFGMEIWNEGAGLSRWAPAGFGAAPSGCPSERQLPPVPRLRDARGWNIIPRGEPLRELSQLRGFAEELSGIFLGEAAVRERSVQKATSQSNAASELLVVPVVCGIKSPLAGLGMLLSWFWQQREPRGRGAAAPGLELRQERGLSGRRNGGERIWEASPHAAGQGGKSRISGC